MIKWETNLIGMHIINGDFGSFDYMTPKIDDQSIRSNLTIKIALVSVKGLLFLCIIAALFLSSCSLKPANEKSRIDYRIGNSFIRVSIDNSGHAIAQSGQLTERDDNSFVIARISDSTKFTVKAGGEFINRLKEFNKPVIETGNGYSRTQIFLGDSLYYDTNVYSLDFWKLYSIISEEIPNEFNPFKTHKFD